MVEKTKAYYNDERRRAVMLLENIPDQRLIYVLDFLRGAIVPEEDDPFYSPENMEHLKKSIAELEAVRLSGGKGERDG